MPQLILVVDDDPAVVELIELNLLEAGYEVMTAATGRDALEKIAVRRSDLILLDLMLPDIDGFGVCQTIPPGRTDRPGAAHARQAVATGAGQKGRESECAFRTEAAQDVGVSSGRCRRSARGEFSSVLGGG